MRSAVALRGGVVLDARLAGIGVAAFPDAASSADQRCHEADHAMYVAKRAGRNQVFRAGQSAGDRRKKPSRH